jgi:hypothetical protein
MSVRSAIHLSHDEDDDYLTYAVFSEDIPFYIFGYVNKHNCHVWGSKNPHIVMEYETAWTKVSGEL